MADLTEGLCARVTGEAIVNVEMRLDECLQPEDLFLLMWGELSGLDFLHSHVVIMLD